MNRSRNKKNNSKKEYFGISGAYRLKVISYGNNFSLVKSYRSARGRGYDKRLTWNFNKDGRICFLECYFNERNNYYRFFEILNYNSSDFKERWVTNIAFTHPLFEGISEILKTSEKLEPVEQYESFVVYGHKMVRKLCYTIQNNEIYDPKIIRGGQKGLTQIVEDKNLLNMIEEITKIEINLRLLNRGNILDAIGKIGFISPNKLSSLERDKDIGFFQVDYESVNQ